MGSVPWFISFALMVGFIESWEVPFIPTNYEWFLALLVYGSIGATSKSHRIKAFDYNKNLICKQNIPETYERQCEPSKSVPNTKTKWVFTSSQPKTPHKRKVSPFFSTHLHFVGHRAPGWWLKDLCSFYSTSEIEVSTMDASPYRLMWFQASKPKLSQIGTKYYPPKKSLITVRPWKWWLEDKPLQAFPIGFR